MSQSFIDTVRDFIHVNKLVTAGDRIVVAVSGGQDSCAMLHCLVQLQNDLGIELVVCHLDHGFRGEESAKDREFVEDLALSLGVSCVSNFVDVPSVAVRLHLSSQEAARHVRHEFLQETADRYGANKIALGHTSDDLVETVLLNAFRGSGIDGLVGLRPQRSNRLRPLLGITRNDTLSYCHEKGIAFREDSSNGKLNYRRNHLRMELLPTLESYYNKDIRAAIARLSKLAQRDSDALNEMADSIFVKIGSVSDSRASIPWDQLLSYPSAVRSRVIRKAIESVRGHLTDVDMGMVEKIVDMGERTGKSSLNLPGNVTVQCKLGVLSFIRNEAATSALPCEKYLNIRGDTLVGDQVVRTTRSNFDKDFGILDSADARNVVVDARKIDGALRVRNRRPGDRMQPFGMSGTRKLQDILTDKKIPANLRDKVPIIVDDYGIVWVAGLCIDQRVSVSPDTEDVISIELMEQEEWQRKGV